MSENLSQEEMLKAQDERLARNLGMIKNKIIVMSGKGGVGKTTVAINLAHGLAQKGYTVGILDTDIHGPNIAKMLGIENERACGTDTGIHPIKVTENLWAISISLFADDQDSPFIWRGPRKMAMIKQFLSDVIWGNLDYLIIDSPPGTGDEPLSVCQLIPDLNGSIIITTPQDVAILDSRKSVNFSKQLNIPVIGIIENMSGFKCPHCEGEINLFSVGGGKKAAESLNVPFLGSLPLDPVLVKLGDAGTPFIQEQKESIVSVNMNKIISGIEARAIK